MQVVMWMVFLALTSKSPVVRVKGKVCLWDKFEECIVYLSNYSKIIIAQDFKFETTVHATFITVEVRFLMKFVVLLTVMSMLV